MRAIVCSGPPVTRPQFLSWCHKHPDTLSLTQLLATASRVELSARPRNVQEEARIIASVMKEYNPQSPGAPGTTWHVVPYAWWARWCTFTSYTGPGAASSTSGLVGFDGRQVIPWRFQTLMPQEGGEGGNGTSPGPIDLRCVASLFRGHDVSFQCLPCLGVLQANSDREHAILAG